MWYGNERNSKRIKRVYMKIWLTTDTHFSHGKMVEFGRPKDFEQKIWNSLIMYIEEGDVLIHLGDFCIGNDEENHRRFNGQIKGKHIFVRGNHDSKSDNWYYERGWDFVCKEFSLKRKGKRVVFSHIPILKRAGIDHNIHGHTHGNMHRDEKVRDYYDKSFHIELALENTFYEPVMLDTLL